MSVDTSTTVVSRLRFVSLPPFFYKVMPPYKFHYIRKYLALPNGQKLKMLDVGAGCDSSLMARRWFKNLEFHGLDKLDGAYYENYRSSYEAMDKVYNVDLESADLSSVPDNYFDAIVFTHCIEHISTGPEIIRQLAEKIRHGGVMYVEFPNPRSLRFGGALNFSVDPTHISLYDYKDVARMALGAGLYIVRAGTRRPFWRSVLLTPPGLLYWCFELMLGRTPTGRGLGEVAGIADYVFCQKHRVQPSP